MIALVLAAALAAGGSIAVSATVVCPYGAGPDRRCLRERPAPAAPPGTAGPLAAAAPAATSSPGAVVTVSPASDVRPATVTVQH